jgi:drug/metabolite transporter (DMT)-like permease
MNATLLGVLLAALCAMLDGVGQFSLKRSTRDASRRLAWIAVAIGLFALQAVFYVGALRYIPVGAAFAITSLSLVAATVLSRELLGETVTRLRWVGVLLIVVGTALVAAAT